jgi:hypothetical protein
MIDLKCNLYLITLKNMYDSIYSKKFHDYLFLEFNVSEIYSIKNIQ